MDGRRMCVWLESLAEAIRVAMVTLESIFDINMYLKCCTFWLFLKDYIRNCGLISIFFLPFYHLLHLLKIKWKGPVLLWCLENPSINRQRSCVIFGKRKEFSLHFAGPRLSWFFSFYILNAEITSASDKSVCIGEYSMFVCLFRLKCEPVSVMNVWFIAWISYRSV